MTALDLDLTLDGFPIILSTHSTSFRLLKTFKQRPGDLESQGLVPYTLGSAQAHFIYKIKQPEAWWQNSPMVWIPNRQVNKHLNKPPLIVDQMSGGCQPGISLLASHWSAC